MIKIFKNIFIVLGIGVFLFIVYDGWIHQDLPLFIKEFLIFAISGIFGRGLTRLLDMEYRDRKYKVQGDVNNSIKSLREVLRNIVYQFEVKKKNNDFLLDIKLRNKVVMQVLHRTHFPEIYDKSTPLEDMSFGMVIYLPYDQLPAKDIQKLFDFLKEEYPLWKGKPYPDDYIVIDIGTKVGIGGHLITQILKKIFYLLDERELSYELFDEGELPYPVYKKS